MVAPESRSGLAERIRSEQDRAVAEQHVLPQARAAWMRYAPQSRSRRSPWLALTGYALAGAAAAAGLIFVLGSRPIRFDTQGMTSPAASIGEPMQPVAAQGLVQFSDGSQVVLQGRSRARVAQVHTDGARVVLEEGALHADIQHRAFTSWSFQAGPFDVAVTGTQFDLKWQQDSGSLTLSMQQGSVMLSGCSIEPVTLRAGQSKTVQCAPRDKPVASAELPASSASTELPAQSASAQQVASAAMQQVESIVEEATTDAGGPDATAPDWKKLAATGKYKEAFAAAEAAGFEQQCDSAGGRELLDLADAALYAGRADRATLALMRVRSRFAGSGNAATAAYKLGRIAFDQRGALGDARNWFSVYLQEAPGGSLAREAMGRLIEIDHRTGNTAAARARAEQYLKLFPQGPHAALARSLVQ